VLGGATLHGPMPFFGFSIASLVVAFVMFMGVSAAFFPMNMAASIVAGLVAIGGSTLVALATTGRDWRTATGLSVFRGRDVAMGALLSVGNALSLCDWVGRLSTSLFPQALVDLFDTGKTLTMAMTNWLEQAAVLVAVVVLAPLGEELLFRGVLLRGLRERLGIVASVAVSACLFSAYHLDPVGFLPRLEIGIVLALVVWKTGSLWPAVAAHAANNALAMVLTAAAIEDSDVPWWVGMVALGVFVAASAWFWSRPTLAPPEALPSTPVPFFRAAGPWVLPPLVSAVLIATFDARGGELTRIDLSAPLLGKVDETEQAALLVLRAQARSGDVDCEAYGKRRRALSQARLKTLIEQWLPKAPSRTPGKKP